jgi:hypothetical protein
MTPHVSIGLVGCSGPKLEEPAPARQLYTSQLFRSALALAERRHDVVYVISAKHELVALDQVVAPYDLTMGDVAKEWRAIWGQRVWWSIQHRHPRVERAIYIYAGKDYARPIRRAGFNGATFHEPLARMQVGQRLKWLREQLDDVRGRDTVCGVCGRCALCRLEGPDCEAYAMDDPPEEPS